MIVEILCGGYGCPTKTGVHTVAHGERCEVSDAEAARLIGLGVAKCAFSAPTAPETAPADVPATAEGNDTPAAEASQNGSEAAHLDPDQLHDMTVANLKKLLRQKALKKAEKTGCGYGHRHQAAQDQGRTHSGYLRRGRCAR